MTDLLLQVFLGFLGGVLLNLTPCVLPVIPLKVAAIVRESGHSRRRRMASAGALLAGTLTVFVLLGAVSALLNMQWGFLFQSRIFLSLLVALLLATGVVMVLHLPLRLPLPGNPGATQRLGPFATGAFAGVLSTPCTGPFLGSTLAFSLTQPASTTLIIFTAIGLGMAAPYCLLLASPAVLNRFPRGGPWLVRVEELLGFILIAGGVFFLGSLVGSALERSLWFALAAAFACWAAWHGWRAAGAAARAVPAVALSAAVGIGLANHGLQTQNEYLPWQPFSRAALADAAIAGRPALIEFTADWCINCKVLERTVYADPRVVGLGAEHGFVPLRLDLTGADETGQALLRNYGGAGIPFAVVIDRRGQPIRTFPDLFSGADLLSAMQYAAVPASKLGMN